MRNIDIQCHIAGGPQWGPIHVIYEWAQSCPIPKLTTHVGRKDPKSNAKAFFHSVVLLYTDVIISIRNWIHSSQLSDFNTMKLSTLEPKFKKCSKISYYWLFHKNPAHWDKKVKKYSKKVLSFLYCKRLKFLIFLKVFGPICGVAAKNRSSIVW